MRDNYWIVFTGLICHSSSKRKQKSQEVRNLNKLFHLKEVKKIVGQHLRMCNSQRLGISYTDILNYTESLNYGIAPSVQTRGN